MDTDEQQMKRVAGALGVHEDVLRNALASGGTVHLATLGAEQAQTAMAAMAAIAPPDPPPNRVRYWRGADGTLAASDRDRSATMTEVSQSEYEAAVAEARDRASAARDASIAAAVATEAARTDARRSALEKLAAVSGLTPDEVEALLP